MAQASVSGYRVYLYTGGDPDALLTIAEAERLAEELATAIADVKRSADQLRKSEHESARQANELAAKTKQKVQPEAKIKGETLSDSAADEAAGRRVDPTQPTEDGVEPTPGAEVHMEGVVNPSERATHETPGSKDLKSEDIAKGRQEPGLKEVSSSKKPERARKTPQRTVRERKPRKGSTGDPGKDHSLKSQMAMRRLESKAGPRQSKDQTGTDPAVPSTEKSRA